MYYSVMFPFFLIILIDFFDIFIIFNQSIKFETIKCLNKGHLA